jgi:hypothetical protein
MFSVKLINFSCFKAFYEEKRGKAQTERNTEKIEFVKTLLNISVRLGDGKKEERQENPLKDQKIFSKFAVSMYFASQYVRRTWRRIQF